MLKIGLHSIGYIAKNSNYSRFPIAYDPLPNPKFGSVCIGQSTNLAARFVCSFGHQLLYQFLLLASFSSRLHFIPTFIFIKWCNFRKAQIRGFSRFQTAKIIRTPYFLFSFNHHLPFPS